MTNLLLFLHLVAAAFWLGGLLALGIFVWAGLTVLGCDDFRRLLRRAGWTFAWAAAATWLLLGVTGILLARAHLASLAELRTTHFGLLLEAKAAWALVALAAAAGHVLSGRSRSRGLVRLSRALALVTLVATLVTFYYGTLLA